MVMQGLGLGVYDLGFRVKVCSIGVGGRWLTQGLGSQGLALRTTRLEMSKGWGLEKVMYHNRIQVSGVRV